MTMTFRAADLLSRLLVALLLLAAVPASARAFAIQEVTSPGGLKAWLVEDKSVPLIAMSFSFGTGSAADPDGKSGVANFITGMMDEGAADLDSKSFQKRRDELGFRLSFDAGTDNFEGSVQTLVANRDASFDMLRKAVTAPQFANEPLERMRQGFLLDIAGKNDDPQSIAYNQWLQQVMPGDPYARRSSGTAETVASITAQDLKDAHRRIFTRSTLRIAVVGDIDAVTLGPLLDTVFGALPEGVAVALPPVKVSSTAEVKVISRNIPQSIIVFGHDSIRRDDPDFIPAFVMSEILGGDGFGSRLTTEIREKRGLTYGVGAGLSPLRRVGLYAGSLSTRNEKAGEALAVVRQELRRMAEDGPTQQELDEAKTYLTGSYALRFTSNSAIANQLLGLQQQGMGIDYIDKRNSLITAVTLDQVKAAARRLLHPDRLSVTIVGKPEGLN